ncbi:MAG: hypothetical protein LAN59_07900 [Acidobacteriia bacterium]|nr:hypothetical protein [Terriglobia bacterium]
MNLAGERALSSFDQRHRFVASALIESPWKGGSDATMGSRILAGFELAPIVTYGTGRPFNLLTLSDVNSDRHYASDRPLGAPRNSGIGPDFLNLDLRLSRTVKFGERISAQLMAEGFNLANRTNYATVNNLVAANFAPPFNVHGSAAIAPNQPLDFASAYAKRQIQFGLRLSF